MGSILDRQSVALLRAVSRGGWVIPQDLSDQMVPREVEGRLRAFRATGVLQKFRALPFLPALLGGVWGRYVIRFHHSDKKAEERVIQGLSGIEESLHNAVFFTRRFPRTTLFLFSRTQEELDLILRESGVAEKPILIKAYNFPFPTMLSEDERRLLEVINKTGEVFPDVLAAEMKRDASWVQAKLGRLVHHSDNPQGVAVLRATIHWYKIDNFIHAHILLPINARERIEELFVGLVWNHLDWPGESSETIPVEADFAGWGEFAAWKERTEIAGFPLSGFAFFAEERVWGKGYEY